MADPFLEVGALVRHRDAPEWGLGQVQSVVQSILGPRVTVNFENAGKIVLQGDVPLEVVEPERPD